MALGNPISVGDESAGSVTIIATANQTLFNINDLSGGYKINQINVYRNGVRLADGIDYLARDGKSITLLSGASDGDVLEFQIFDDFKVPDAIAKVDSNQTILGNLTIKGNLYANPDIFATGVVTATAFYGDGSNLTLGGRTWDTYDFIASGNISNGEPVVINTDGTVSVISGTGSLTPTVDSIGLFDDSNPNISSAYSSNNNKVVVAYAGTNTSGNGYVVVGEMVGTGITFGTPLRFNTQNTDLINGDISVVYDSTNEKVVIAYKDDSTGVYDGKAVVGTVAGLGITFGTPVVFYDDGGFDGFNTSTIYDSTNDKVVIVFDRVGSETDGKVIVGAVSGDTIGFGTTTTFHTGDDIIFNSGTYDSTNGKVVIFYGAGSGSKAVVGTVTGLDITFGTPVEVGAGDSLSNSAYDITYDSANSKVVITSTDASDNGYAVVGTVSGDTISFGTPTIFENGETRQSKIIYNPIDGTIFIFYKDFDDNGYGKMVEGYVSGTDITFSPPTIFNDNNVNEISATYSSSANKAIVAYAGEYAPSQADNRAKTISPTSENFTTNLTEENYVGIAAENISDTETGKVTIYCGVNKGQTGLTTAKDHYINPVNGNLESSIPNIISYVPSLPTVVAGHSISSTEILVKHPRPNPDLAGISGLYQVELRYVQYDLDTDRFGLGVPQLDEAFYGVVSNASATFTFAVDFNGDEEVDLSKILIVDYGIFPYYRKAGGTGQWEYYNQIEAYYDGVLIDKTPQKTRSLTNEPTDKSFIGSFYFTNYRFFILQDATFRFRDMYGEGASNYILSFKRPCSFYSGSYSCSAGQDISLGVLDPGEQTPFKGCSITGNYSGEPVDCSFGIKLLNAINGTVSLNLDGSLSGP